MQVTFIICFIGLIAGYFGSRSFPSFMRYFLGYGCFSWITTQYFISEAEKSGTPLSDRLLFLANTQSYLFTSVFVGCACHFAVTSFFRERQEFELIRKQANHDE